MVLSRVASEPAVMFLLARAGIRVKAPGREANGRQGCCVPSLKNYDAGRA
jgi:hypothetical protein